MQVFVDTFRYKSLHIHNAAPAEVLDRFTGGLSVAVYAQSLVTNPQDFDHAVLLAE